MCGFFFTKNDSNVDLQSVLGLMRHRGPDSTCILETDKVKCGFNRLAIINKNNNSNQPMLDNTGRYILLFNGELYNYRDLKQRLNQKHRIEFKTTSDTEVILYALIYEGFEIINTFEGIFSIVFYDKKLDVVTLIRDQVGVKPIYYSIFKNNLYISSEVKPIAKVIKTAIDVNAVSQYLSYGVADGKSCVVKGVCKVIPGEIVRIERDLEVKSSKYDNTSYKIKNDIEVEDVHRLVQDTVRSQIPKIDYGIMFSGGVDSSLLLALAYNIRIFSGVYCVNVNHSDMSEKVYQNLAINKFGIKNISYNIENTRDDFTLNSLEKIASKYDLPVIHPNYIGSYLLTKAASSHGLKVLLSGEGADEVFLGYRWFLEIGSKSQSYLQYVKHKDIKFSINGFNEAKKLNCNNLSIVESFQNIYLQKWLTRQDLAGMSNSIEVRVPFLGQKLVNFVNQIKYEDKIKDNISKYYLKKISELYYDKKYVYRKKVGFDYPLNEWIDVTHFDYLISQSDLYDADYINELWKNRKNTYYAARCLFVLVMYSLWVKKL